MNFLIFAALVHLSQCGVISQDHGIEHHERATSYQNIHIEHFHPVPTFLKKEHQQLLEHPVALGTTSSKVEVHHGGKHDHGYAFASAENNIHGHGFENFDGLTGGHEIADAHAYQVQDQGAEYAHFQGAGGQIAHFQGAEGQAAHFQGVEGQAEDAGHYQLSKEHQGLQAYANIDAGHLQYGHHEA